MLKREKLDRIGGRMKARGILIRDIAQMMGRERNYVSVHLKKPLTFTLGEIYIICEALDIEDERISEFFPREERKC